MIPENLIKQYEQDGAVWDPREGTDPIVTQDHVGIKPGESPRSERWFPKVWSAS